MEYIYTERAHLMCPNMYFGIIAIVNSEYNQNRIKDVIAKASAAHPFLRARLGFEKDSNRYFYDVTDSSKVELIFGHDQVTALDSPKVMEEYEVLLSRDWNLFEEGMLKIVAWKACKLDETNKLAQANKTCFLFVFHHLLADGRGAWGLAQEIADSYAKGSSPIVAEEKLISSRNDFPEKTGLSFLSSYFVNKANREWGKENHKPLTYSEYNAFANAFIKQDRVNHSFEILDEEKLSELVSDCKKQSVTVNDMLMARMFVEDQTEKIIIARDLRESFSFYRPGALGNYSTAFSINLKKKNADKSEVAKAVHKKVQTALKNLKEQYLVLQCYADLTPVLLDASFMAAQGKYDSKAAAFIGKTFFAYDKAKGYSITNLGNFSIDVKETACFNPPPSPAIRKTWGVLTVNGRMVICTSERKQKIHEMHLNPEPFALIKNGSKKIELRLYDEKRQQIKIGDKIVFTNTESTSDNKKDGEAEKLEATVTNLFVFDSFEKLYQELNLVDCGYTEENLATASPEDMTQYYPKELQQKYGVVGIQIELLKKES